MGAPHRQRSRKAVPLEPAQDAAHPHTLPDGVDAGPEAEAAKAAWDAGVFRHKITASVHPDAALGTETFYAWDDAFMR